MISIFKTKIGYIRIEYNDDTLNRLGLCSELDITDEEIKLDPFTLFVKKELDEYLEGERTVFSVKTLVQGTEFQIKVWDELKKIPYGETSSYKEIGEKLNTKAYQAIGNAIHNNPLFIIIPCHRVIKYNGKLGGFAYGSIMKNKLLDIEKENK